jgi:hypothetical protein
MIVSTLAFSSQVDRHRKTSSLSQAGSTLKPERYIVVKSRRPNRQSALNPGRLYEWQARALFITTIDLDHHA